MMTSEQHQIVVAAEPLPRRLRGLVRKDEDDTEAATSTDSFSTESACDEEPVLVLEGPQMAPPLVHAPPAGVSCQPSARRSCLTSGKHSHKKVVSFDTSTVSIRHFAYILGDNPSCVIGPPIQCGWEILLIDGRSEVTHDLAEYEKYYHKKRAIPSSGQRVPKHLRKQRRQLGLRQFSLSAEQRCRLLTRIGYSKPEWLAVEKEMRRIQHQRTFSAIFGPLLEPIQLKWGGSKKASTKKESCPPAGGRKTETKIAQPTRGQPRIIAPPLA
jgi:hypothetical protein